MAVETQSTVAARSRLTERRSVLMLIARGIIADPFYGSKRQTGIPIWMRVNLHLKVEMVSAMLSIGIARRIGRPEGLKLGAEPPQRRMERLLHLKLVV